MVAQALIRDFYQGREMARISSFVMIIFSTVPALAPLMGSFVMLAFAWQAIFGLFILFVAISTILLKRHAGSPETLPALADDAIELLLNYGWPGNVRELENVLQRALVLCSDNMITAGDIMVDGMVNEQLTSSRMMQADSQQFLSA